jgi:hypothetical protein
MVTVKKGVNKTTCSVQGLFPRVNSYVSENFALCTNRELSLHVIKNGLLNFQRNAFVEETQKDSVPAIQ